MKTFKKVVTIALIFAMTAVMLYGCKPKTEEKPPVSTPPLDDISQHEVYTMDNRVPWGGIDANIQPKSRADIYKGIKAENKKDKIKVGYATWTVSTPFFVAMKDTIEAECKKYGYDFTYAVSDMDINRQIANIENMVTLGCDVIIEAGFNAEADTPAIEAAVKAGVPVISLGLPFPERAPIITTAATNYYEQGFMVGQYAAKQFKGKAVKAALSPGMIGHTIAESKLNGFIGGFVYERAIQMGKPFAVREDAMLHGYNLHMEITKKAKFSDPNHNWEVVVSIDGYWSQDGGMKAAEDILTGNPDINLLFTDNDQQGFGALKAIKAAGLTPGKDLLLCSVGDGTKEALELVKSGEYLTLTLASPYTWSKAPMDLIRKIFADGFDATNLPANTYLDDVLVTKDNVDQYMPTREYTSLPDAVFTPIGK